MTRQILALCLVLLGIAFSCYGDGILVSTSMVYRHGDRASTTAYPLDRVNESFWSYGYGQLTDIGKGQQYRLGTLLRTRYDTLLRDVYWYKNIAVRTSNLDRCHVSAYSNLAGVYSNSTQDDDLRLPFINWQPIPVHSVPEESDDLLAMGRPCSLVNQVTLARLFGEDVRQINKDYAEFFDMISEKTGVTTWPNGLIASFLPADNLFCEQANGLPLPEWALATGTTCNDNEYIPCEGKTVFEILTDMASYFFFIMYEPPSIHPFRGGPLLVDILEKFQAFAAGERSIAFNMYSGHDSTVSATLSALGVYDGVRPPYTSCILFDLHQQDDGEYIVTVSYRNVTDDSSVYPIELPGCPSPCTLVSFSSMLDDYKVDDWDQACGNDPTSNAKRQPSLATPESLSELLTDLKEPHEFPPSPEPAHFNVETVTLTVCGTVLLSVLMVACLCHVMRGQSGYSSMNGVKA